ncbi:MAG: L-rhamnose mutarotase [Victivallales bacterium]|nr:L-rhamnose mutarotase [Victivallales bacterium]
MKRNAFKMKLKPGMLEEYRRRHDGISPEMLNGLRQAGISNYSIFYDPETNSLFAVQDITDDDKIEQFLESAVFKEWRKHMSDIMELEPEHNKPITLQLSEVFHMD